MRRLSQIAAMLLLPLSALAQAPAPAPPAVSAEQVDRARASAEVTSGEPCVQICMEAARLSVELSNRYFTEGSVDAAQALMRDGARFAEKAAQASIETRKKQKQTEISLRRLSKRVEDIAETLAFEDRPAVQQVAESMDKLRSEVLVSIFGVPDKALTPDSKDKK